MCVSCGCDEIHDDHGDSRHLTIEDLEQAAEAANLTVDQVVQNIETSRRQGGSNPSSSRRA
jgi:predicted DNA-binding ribbon-helix-helix protein